MFRNKQVTLRHAIVNVNVLLLFGILRITKTETERSHGTLITKTREKGEGTQITTEALERENKVL